MSALLGVFGPGAEQLPEPVVHEMLAAMAARGSDAVETWAGPGAVLAVARDAWELGAGFSDGELVVEEGDLVVVADAAIYYRAELTRRLRHPPPVGTAARLVLAAYRQWGAACLEYLEGDFAFLVWDRTERSVVCARDPSGSAALFQGRAGGDLVIASSVAGIAAHPRFRGDLNLAAIADGAAALIYAHHETSYVAVERVPAGRVLVSAAGGALREVGRAPAPIAGMRDRRPLAEAAEELRHLLDEAVAERLSPAGDTCIWLSGGYDSTALYATGMHRLRHGGDDRSLQAVSIRYPPGDPGHEDEYVLATAERWGGSVRWIDSETLAPFADIARRAATWEDAASHRFEVWNQATARGSQEAGCSVAFTGMGGDILFANLTGYLTDLALYAGPSALLEEWRACGRPPARQFARDVLEPLAPDALRRGYARLRGNRPPADFMMRPVPGWIRGDFAARHALYERQRHTPPEGSRGLVGRHFTHYLTHPYFARNPEQVATSAAPFGVAVRNPIYDRRVIEFAGRRPLTDRRAAGESKWALRTAMAGLVPEPVLAPRPVRTGVTAGLLAREVRHGARPLFEAMLKNPVLAELGIIDAAALRQAWERFMGGRLLHGAGELAGTLQAELWVRTRSGETSAPHVVPAVTTVHAHTLPRP